MQSMHMQTNNTCSPPAHEFAYDLVALQRQNRLKQAEANSDHVACAIEMHCLPDACHFSSGSTPLSSTMRWYRLWIPDS